MGFPFLGEFSPAVSLLSDIPRNFQTQSLKEQISISKPVWVRNEARFSRWFSYSLWYWLTPVTHSFSCWLGLGSEIQKEMWISRILELIFFFFFLGCFTIQRPNHTFLWHSKCFWEEGGNVWDSQVFVLGLTIPIKSIWWLRRSAGLCWKETWIFSVDGERNFAGNHIRGLSGRFPQEVCLNFSRSLS